MRWALRIAVAASILTLCIVGFVAWRVTRTAWAPLGPFPEQQVLAGQTVEWQGETYSDAVTEVPAVKVTDAVRVEGTKCSTETVEVNGDKSWLLLDPRGFTDYRGSSSSTRQQGCRSATFENPIPQGIRDEAARQFAAGRTFVIVQISGCETPVRANAEAGEVLCWRTEPFALVP